MGSAAPSEDHVLGLPEQSETTAGAEAEFSSTAFKSPPEPFVIPAQHKILGRRERWSNLQQGVH